MSEEQRLGEPVGPSTPGAMSPPKVIPGGQPNKFHVDGTPMVWQMYTMEERAGHKLKKGCEVCGKEFPLAGMKIHMARMHRGDDSDISAA